MASFDVPKRLHAAQHATGQPDAITPASIGAAPASRFLTGTGSPEGVTTAPIGTTYVDTAATAGALEWTKWSGTGTTGWRVTKGDTGFRNIAVNSPATSPVARVRRVGEIVYLTLSTTYPSGWTAGEVLLTIPQGFRTPNHYSAPPYSGTGPLAIGGDGVARLWAAASTGASLSWSTTWASSDPWPTTLPA